MAAFPEEFSNLLIKFPVNKGQKISNLVICCKMIIYRFSQRNCVEKLRNIKSKKEINGLLFSDPVGSEKR